MLNLANFVGTPYEELALIAEQVTNDFARNYETGVSGLVRPNAVDFANAFKFHIDRLVLKSAKEAIEKVSTTKSANDALRLLLIQQATEYSNKISDLNKEIEKQKAAH
jgi:hypothetical protein